MPPDPPDTASPATPMPDRPRWRRPGRLLLVGCAVLTAVALVVTASVQALRPGAELAAEPEPVRVVREFLAAIVARDPQRALAIAGVANPPTGEQARFLRPDALSDQWEVRDVVAAEAALATGGPARVQVTIAGPDGATVQSTITTRPGADGQWVIAEPFATATFIWSPLWYVDVNGVRAPADVDELYQEYLLLPGFYDFYPQLPPGVEADFEDQLLLPGSPAVVAAQGVTLTETGQAVIRQAVEAYVDTCAQSTDLTPHACPFGSDTYSQLPGYSIGWSFGDEVQWTVREYPVVTAAPAVHGFHIADRQRGVVELRATVEWVEHDQRVLAGQDMPYEPPEEGSVASVECEIDTSYLEAGFTATGEVVIASGHDRDAYPDQDPQDRPNGAHITDTCGYVTIAAA